MKGEKLVRDNKRLFDEVGQIALPYLVYAENETFRVNLAKELAKITHHYLRQSEMQLFPKAVEGIMDMIEEYRNTAGTENVQTIDMYAAEISTLEDRFIQLSEKVDAFIKKSNNKSIKKGKSPVIKAISPETPIEGSLPIEVPISNDTKEEVPLEVPIKAEKIKLPNKRPTRHEIEQRFELIKNYLKTNSEIDNQKCREICNINISQASRLLHMLVKDNFIEKIGLKKNTKYILK